VTLLNRKKAEEMYRKLLQHTRKEVKVFRKTARYYAFFRKDVRDDFVFRMDI